MPSVSDLSSFADARAPRQPLRDGSYVLVVEAEAELGRQLHQVLADAGYAVRLVPDGWAALLCILDGVPAAAIAGRSLPVMTGWELHHVLQAADLRVPVVDLSSSGMVHATTTRHDLTEYVAAPLDAMAVLAVVTRVASSV